MKTHKRGYWKFKKDVEPQGSSDGFWYDLTNGGYINPADLLADKKQLKEVLEAIALLKSFKKGIEEANLLNEF